MQPSSRAGTWFGSRLEDGSPPASPSRTSSSRTLTSQATHYSSATTATIVPQNNNFSSPPPTIDHQHVYDRYFQQVTRKDFLNSPLLLQYARERKTTPHQLYKSYCAHLKKSQLPNTLTHLIDFLGTSKTTANSIEKHFFNSRTTPVYEKTGRYNYHQPRIPGSEYKNGTQHVFKTYTHADFLRVKKEAEEAFEKKIKDEEEKVAEDNRRNEAVAQIDEMHKDKNGSKYKREKVEFTHELE